MVKAKETLTTWSRTHRLFTAETSWFTVWANGKQNFRLVNFVTESRLSFLQIMQFPLPKNDCEGLILVSRCDFTNGTQISLWNILPGKNRTTFSDVQAVTLCLRMFRWNKPKRHVPFTFTLDFMEKFC